MPYYFFYSGSWDGSLFGVGIIYLTLKVLRRISEKIDSRRVRETSADLLETLADKLKGEKK